MAGLKHALVVPVYRNAESITDLVAAIAGLARATPGGFTATFVVDGSPDDSHARLMTALAEAPFRSKLILLSRNFGSFAAIRAGLAASEADFYAVMAADLQEPPELVVEFFKALREEPLDVVVGTRTARDDPWSSRVASTTFWKVYRRLVQPDMPEGGVDVFGCNRVFRDALLALESNNTSLVGQLIWLGFRRRAVPYARLPRAKGKSGWTLSKKIDYLLDSLFAFSDLPVRALLFLGAIGLVVSVVLGVAIFAARVAGLVTVPGYAPTVLLILFFGALNLFGLGIVGSYAYRAFTTSKRRPLVSVLAETQYGPDPTP